jgi:hypothetical protein
LDKINSGWNVIAKAAAQIIQTNDSVPLLHQMRRDVGTDETGRAGDQNL